MSKLFEKGLSETRGGLFVWREVPSYTITRKYLFYIFVFYGRLFVV